MIRRVTSLPKAVGGQGMTEYVILSAVMVAIAAYLYHPDNLIFYGIRKTYNKTSMVVGWPGP